MTHDTSHTRETCVTCGTALVGPWCHACGEHADVRDTRHFVPFVRNMLSGTFDVDSRLSRTFRALFRRPGLLTVEFMRGRRRPYLTPLQTFLIANLVFFAALTTIGGFNIFTTQLVYHQTQPLHGRIASHLVAQEIPADSAGAAAYHRRFNEASPRYANSLVILMVPLLATLIALQFRMRGYFVRHLVFALHFMALLLLTATALSLVLTIVLRGLFRIAPGVVIWASAGEWPISILMLAMFSTWLALAFRRAYDLGTTESIIRGLVATISLLPALMVYRAILFFTVFYSLR